MVCNTVTEDAQYSVLYALAYSLYTLSVLSPYYLTHNIPYLRRTETCRFLERIVRIFYLFHNHSLFCATLVLSCSFPHFSAVFCFVLFCSVRFGCVLRVPGAYASAESVLYLFQCDIQNGQLAKFGTSV